MSQIEIIDDINSFPDESLSVFKFTPMCIIYIYIIKYNHYIILILCI